MRHLPLKDMLQSLGASFSERDGVEVVSRFSDKKTEYEYIRSTAGVTDFSYMQIYRIPEEKAIDFLDVLLAGNVAKTRFGRVLHTFMADEKGELVSDCYVANNDEEFLLLCESIDDDASINAIIDKAGGSEAEVTELTGSVVAVGIDGYKAWEVAKQLFGTDILGLPYLSIETYPFEGTDIRLIRAGKTSEFGYSLIAPLEVAEKLFSAIKDTAEKLGGGLCGTDIHNDLRLEGRFFNIFAEGRRVKDPLTLGLQWMIDFDKDGFHGSSPILARRNEGLKKKITGVRGGPGVQFEPGESIFSETGDVGTVVTSCYSFVLDRHIGLALFPVEIAYAGLAFTLDKAAGRPLETISMPPIMPKSLNVKLDEM